MIRTQGHMFRILLPAPLPVAGAAFRCVCSCTALDGRESVTAASRRTGRLNRDAFMTDKERTEK